MGGAYLNKGIFLHGFKLCRESRTAASDFGIHKENWGNHAFFKDNIKLQFEKKKRHTLLCIFAAF